MRYDNLLRNLEKARAKYESDVKRLLSSAAKMDASMDGELMASLKPKKKKHWTQLPKNKARVKAIQRKMQAAKVAK